MRRTRCSSLLTVVRAEEPRGGYRVWVAFSDGILTWPNGFDLDSIALHMEMKERGLLRRTAA